MVYKVTPTLQPVTPRARKPEGTAPKKRPGRKRNRKTEVYDAHGNEVLISLMCLKCKSLKPLSQFGLRKMADGAVRNQPWCRACRNAAVPRKVAALLSPERPVLEAVAAPA